MRKRAGYFAAAAVLAVLIAVFAAVWFMSRPVPQEGNKTVTVEVVHKDGAKKSFTYRTDAEYLGELLLAEGLIEGEEGAYGLYVTVVDGEAAVYEEDQSYWAFYIGGEYAGVGVDQAPVSDGDSFSLVYTVG